MEALFSALQEIQSILEQILAITQNQMTILLETKYLGEGLDMVEQMADFKEQLTSSVECEEQKFQALYSERHNQIIEKEDKKRLKQNVDTIMQLKERIIENEQKNVLVMQDLLRRLAEKVELPKNPERVANAYKAHNKPTT